MNTETRRFVVYCCIAAYANYGICYFLVLAQPDNSLRFTALIAVGGFTLATHFSYLQRTRK